MERNKLRLKPRSGVIGLYMIPSIMLYSLCTIIPILIALYFSFFKWSGGSEMQYIGIGNYIKLVNDSLFWSSFKNNLIFIVLTGVGQIGLAILFTLFLMSPRLKLRETYKSILFFPNVLSALVVGYLWGIVYHSEYGLLNSILQVLGMESLIQNWLGNINIVLYSLSMPRIWQAAGYYLLILLAAAQNISTEVLEVAEIDGATGLKKAIHVILPQMTGTLKIVLILCISANMKTFEQILVMTGGGPANQSMVVALYAYKTSILNMKLGYGSAMAIGILALSLVLIGVAQVIFGGITKWKKNQSI